MRTLLLMRGAPGCGKSTFIKESGLEPYVLSADNLRLQYTSTHLDINGNDCISPQHDNKIWKTLFEILEYRMSLGCFTIIDATNSKTKEMSRYKQLADEYRYRVYVVDMTDVPLDVCIERNKLRPTYKQVPETSIENIYSRFETQSVPSGITIIKPSEVKALLEFKPIDLSKYENIHIIGDIHGCYQALHSYMLQHESDQDAFIFLGDYLDRGTQNAEVFKYVDSISTLPNVIMLEGNHERHLFNYGLDRQDKLTTEFTKYTLPQLVNAGITQKDCRKFYRRLSQCIYFSFQNKLYFCCHGGLSSFPEKLLLVPTRQIIHGVGKYSEYLECTKWWQSFNNSQGIIQINGHRNIERLDIDHSEFCYNLEGQVEFGGDLRIVQLSKNNDSVKTLCHYISNTEPVAEHLLHNDIKIGNDTKTLIINNDTPVGQLISELRNNKYITEKSFGNISSFNFSRDAFAKGIWDNQTIRARGLYIDTVQNKIFARSYEKFFKLNEVEETRLPVLSKTLTFPVTAYNKENGYLGLISYNYYDDTLFYTTKSSIIGDYTLVFKDLFERLVSESNRILLRQFLKTHNLTLVVEVVHPEFDPHIIEYDKPNIYLLDLIYNEIEFRKCPYLVLNQLATDLGLPCKQIAAVLNNYSELDEFITTTGANSSIEGYVLEDAQGFMFKLKSDYYTIWKRLRSVAMSVIKFGNYKYTGSLQTPLENYFYKWIKDHWSEYHYSPDIKCDIITLRKRFLDETKYNIIEGGN